MSNPKTTVVYLQTVIYAGDEKKKVESYNGKPECEKEGGYWDDKDDRELSKVKKLIKDHYLKAQDYRCCYCKQRIVVAHNGAWDTDHIIPKDTHAAFLFEPRNLCVSCKDCNLIKLNKVVLKNQGRKRFPASPKDYIFVHPHFHKYTDHICIVQEAALYLPKTPEGIKLIEVCGLLRFVLRFANYNVADDQMGATMVKLGSALQKAKSPIEEVAIMNIIKTLVDEGLRKAALTQIEEGLSQFA
jgi:5-methylcytosine-specific restriction endonuclease McrA